MRALLLNGSPAFPSRTKALLEYISSLLEQHSVDNEIIDLKNAHLPINDPQYHADAMESPDENVREFAQTIKDSNIVFVGTPLYHGSYSGLLKLALDNLDGDALSGKRIVICSQSSGARNAMQGAQELVVVCRTMGGNVYERLIGTCKADFEQGTDKNFLVDEKIRLRCQEITKDIIS